MATVLVVEKQPNLRLLIDVELEDAGHRSILVATGVEAIRTLQVEQPDITVLGVSQPLEDEVQTLCALKRARPDLPVILFSGAEDAHSRKLERLADAWVEKSSRLEALLQEIDRYCLPGGKAVALV